MSGKCRGGWRVWMVLVISCLAVPRAAAQERLKIGVVSTLFRDTPGALVDIVSRPLMALMESQTGMKGSLALADCAVLAKRLKEKQVQIGVFHSFEFAWARQQCPELKVLAIVVARHRHLEALLVVRKDNAAKHCTDLKGKVLALPAISRGHLHLYLERRSPAPGSDPRKFFAEVQRPGDANNALDDVVDGSAEVALVERSAFEDFQNRLPGRADKLRVLQTETFPASVIAYCPGSLSDAALKKVREGLLGADRSVRGKELLGMCRITGFAEVPADYEKCLVDILKAYPPASAKQEK